MLLAKPNTKWISALTHEGKVLLVATVLENNSTRYVYTVKQDGFEDSALQNPYGTGWEDFKPLPLPNDPIGDPSVKEHEQRELADKNGKLFLRSIHDSAALGADAPVQLVSHDGHVYVFRQSQAGTLLVDRFVLDGMSNTLTPKLEVRFKRSRQRYKPLKDMKINSGGQLESEDALDFRDMDDQQFLAPTIELLLRDGDYAYHVSRGRFGVVVTPTNEQDNYRWQIFSWQWGNSVHLHSVRADSEYIFDVKDHWSRSVDPITDKVSYESIPGLIHRTISLSDGAGNPLNVSNGLAAVQYAVQREQATESGPQLLRDERKIMLSIPTESGIAGLAFAVAADGTLAQISKELTTAPLRQQEREVPLPLDLLDDIRGVGDQTPAHSGSVTGLSRSNEDDLADCVIVKSSVGDPVQELSPGDLVKLTKTKNYNGLYSVTKVDDNTIMIPDGPTANLGEWVKVETEESGLVFDGQLLGYELQDGRLKITAVNHGLATGDKVQIKGSVSYDGQYPVLKQDDHSFTIQRLWDESEAVNIQIEARKRRGLIFDGKEDWIEIPLSPELKLADNFTFEAWLNLDSDDDMTIFAAAQETKSHPATEPGQARLELGVRSGQFYFSSAPGKIDYSWKVTGRQWIHLAFTCRAKALQVFTDGEQVGMGNGNVDLALKATRLTLGAGTQGTPAARLKGQLAEVRLWTTARTPQEIKNSMFLQLTGRESGLAGYWRLGGVAVKEDGTQRVYDFSVNANHGAVHGNPYAGSMALARTLRDNLTQAVKYVNDDLVAVREGATYIESFEFHTTPPIADPKKVKDNQAIFAPSLWGRLSRGAEDKIAFPPQNPNFEFKSLDDGWWSASCRLIVPEGVRLLRGFEIGEVCGDWNTLEIRRPRLTLVSDTVTQSDANESAVLTPLAGIERPAAPLRQLDQLEQAETLNLNLKDELQRKLDDSAAKNLPDKLKAAETEKQKTEEQYRTTKQEYDDAMPGLRGEFSFAEMNGEYFHRGDWVDTRPVVCPPGKVVKGIELIAHPDYKRKKGSGGVLLSLKLQVGSRDGSDKQEIFNSGAPTADQKQMCPSDIDCTPWQVPAGRFVTGVQFDQNNHGHLAFKLRAALEDGTDEKWFAGDTSSTSAFRSEIEGENPYVDTNLVASDDANQPVTGIWLYQKNNRIAPKIGYYEPAEIKKWDDKLAQTDKDKKAALDLYNQLLASSNANDQKRQGWQKQIDELRKTLARIRQEITSASTAYAQPAAEANSAPRGMPPLANAKDPRGLAVQGALLTFAAPVTRLHAMESVTGRVTLTYQENDGVLRQTHYDTTYDADGQGEEWLAEHRRLAIELDGSTPTLSLASDALQKLGEQVTIEFWSRGARDLTAGATFLSATDKDNNTVLRIQLPSEPGEVVWEAGDAKAKLLDRIAHAADKRLSREQWSHWAFVKDAQRGQMRVYVNGVLWHKNDPIAKDGVSLKQSLSTITKISLGGASSANAQDCWKGRIAELRIWDVALNDREIEANSLLTLSGHEPGLVAYYPFSDGDQGKASDLTGNAPPLDILAAKCVPCTAPIGQLSPSPIPLLNETTTFDGAGTLGQLPALDLNVSQGLTIEARIPLIVSKDWMTILELGNGSDQQSIVLSTNGGRDIRFQIHNDGQPPLEVSQDGVDQMVGKWAHITAVVQSEGRGQLYLDGTLIRQNVLMPPQAISRTRNFIGQSSRGDAFFEGKIDFVRVYEYAMDDVQVEALAAGRMSARDVLAVEYSRVRVDARKRKSAAMMRSLALASGDGVRLWDEQRIEELEVKWISNAQINPTLVGYIEGAPPIPSENLTEEQDYNGATSVELVESSDVEYSWTREQEMSAHMQLDLLIGAKSETSAGLGIQTSLEEIKSGVGGDLEIVYGWQNESTVAASHTLMTSERLELRGSQEEDAHFPHLGARFVPKGIGYAVVVSGLADQFVSRLKRSGRMVGYHLLPVEGIPLDVNTITFLINPAYTMAGSLDGLTGSHATSQRFFPHVPELRSQYGSLYSASYFRLQEAYDLKAQIDKQDEQRQAYFHQFNQQLLSDLLVESEVENSEFDTQTAGVNTRQSTSVDLADTNSQIAATEKELEGLTSSQDTDKRKQKQDDLDALKQKRDELEQRQKNEQAERTAKGEARQEDINKKYADLSTRAHASDSFATWQKKMEALQIRAGKRNIVNTYVWDADGGWHAEEQQFANTVEHSIGGSYDFTAGFDVQASIALSKALVEFNLQAQYGITQTMSKTESGGKSLELKVDLSGVESRGITDFRDNPMLPGEKVDRYRFMSFYLENNVSHWHDFFNYVVNPEWLASNDEEARALRQTQAALPNKVWRVLHRVTYVERPALMGFGRTIARPHRAADDIRQLRQQVDDLNTKVAQLQREINDKLDQLLNKK